MKRAYFAMLLCGAALMLIGAVTLLALAFAEGPAQGAGASIAAGIFCLIIAAAISDFGSLR